MSGRLEGRIALVTGASRGIGRAVALRYAQEGAQVIAFARTLGGLEELDDEIKKTTGKSAVLINDNIKDFDKLDQIGAALFQRFGKLDILCGSAAILGQLSPLGHYTPKMWTEVMDINLTANWRLLRALDPLLRASDAGRAIFVTSAVGIDPRMYWGPYAVSKAALEHMVKIYANEVGHTNVRANIINPGAVATKLRKLAFPGEDPGKPVPPEAITEVFVKFAEPSCTLNGKRVDAQ